MQDTNTTEAPATEVPTIRAELIQRLAAIVQGASDRLGDDLRAFYPDEPAIHPDPLVGSLINQAWGGPVYLDRMANRFQAAAVKPMFTRWHREIDGPRLVLVVEREDGSLVEWLELDVRELPERQDLLGRLGERTRKRLLQDAERVAVAMATDEDDEGEQTAGDVAKVGAA